MASVAPLQLEFHRRLAPLNAPHIGPAITDHAIFMNGTQSGSQHVSHWESLLGLSAEEAYQRKREWNRTPLTDLFPRIPDSALESILDLCISKNFTYDLSQSRLWNARRYSAITVAHVRHLYSEYDNLLKEGTERFEARRQSGTKVWKVLRAWCPWDSSNEVLERCFRATLLPLEQREADYMFVDDPMDIDTESDFGDGLAGRVGENVVKHSHTSDFADDPMEID